MNSYEANYKRQFDGVNPITGKPTLITAREKLAKLIDGEWKHSWHWPVYHNDWLDAARDSLDSELADANHRIKMLKVAGKILSNIDRDEVEAGNE